MTYRENVAQAAVALKRGEDANWELARLTFESTLERGDVAAQTDRVSVEKWASDVAGASGRHFGAYTAYRYKVMWRTHGLADAARPAWSEAYVEVTPDGFLTRMAPSNAERVMEHGTPKLKREVFQQLAADPDVIQEAAMLGTPTSKAVSDLYTKTERVREEFREREIEADPISKHLDQVGAALDLEAACNRFARELVKLSEQFAREINEALPRTGTAREEHLYWVRQAIERARSVLNDLEGYAETGRTDLDTFLADVLGGR